MKDYPIPPFPEQQQPMPGRTDKMDPRPDHGEQSYKGSGRLEGMRAVITGADSGIGRAVALAYAREGADVLISYLSEHEEAEETRRLVEEAGRKAVVMPGDIQHAEHCRAIIDRAVSELGGIDILVNNAAHQDTFEEITEIPDEEWEVTFRINIHAMFYLAKAAVPHMKPGSAIINTTSVNAVDPGEELLDYATTKAGIAIFTKGLAKQLAKKGIRVNGVAPGPIWTPLQVVGGQLPGELGKFGQDTPLGRAGQPVELAALYVTLASDELSYTDGSIFGANGGLGTI